MADQTTTNKLPKDPLNRQNTSRITTKIRICFQRTQQSFINNAFIAPALLSPERG